MDQYRIVKVGPKNQREENPWITSLNEIKSWLKMVGQSRDDQPSYLDQLEADGKCFIVETKDSMGNISRLNV